MTQPGLFDAPPLEETPPSPEEDAASEFLFAEEEMVPWKREWVGMPEYSHEDLAPKFQVLVSFACEADLHEFARAIGQKVFARQTGKYTQALWYPEAEIGRMANKRYVSK